MATAAPDRAATAPRERPATLADRLADGAVARLERIVAFLEERTAARPTGA